MNPKAQAAPPKRHSNTRRTYPEKQVLADHKFWKEIEKRLPWRLNGFSYQRSASFFTAPVENTGSPLGDVLCLPRTHPWAMIELTGEQRNQILAAIAAAEEK